MANDMTQTFTTAQGRVYASSQSIIARGSSSVPMPPPARAAGRRSLPIRQGVTRHFGGIEPDVAAGLKLRHDHGSNYMAEDFQKEVRCFGVTSSPSFVRQPPRWRHDQRSALSHFPAPVQEGLLPISLRL